MLILGRDNNVDPSPARPQEEAAAGGHRPGNAFARALREALRKAPTRKCRRHSPRPQTRSEKA